MTGRDKALRHLLLVCGRDLHTAAGVPMSAAYSGAARSLSVRTAGEEYMVEWSDGGSDHSLTVPRKEFSFYSRGCDGTGAVLRSNRAAAEAVWRRVAVAGDIPMPLRARTQKPAVRTGLAPRLSLAVAAVAAAAAWGVAGFGAAVAVFVACALLLSWAELLAATGEARPLAPAERWAVCVGPVLAAWSGAGVLASCILVAGPVAAALQERKGPDASVSGWAVAGGACGAAVAIAGIWGLAQAVLVASGVFACGRGFDTVAQGGLRAFLAACVVVALMSLAVFPGPLPEPWSAVEWAGAVLLVAVAGGWWIRGEQRLLLPWVGLVAVTVTQWTGRADGLALTLAGLGGVLMVRLARSMGKTI